MLPTRPGRAVRRFEASVSFRDAAGLERREAFPLVTFDHQGATRLALAYAVEVLGLAEFELRVVGI
jgi:hypothetical protein